MDKTYTLEELSQLGPGTKIACDSIPFIMTAFFFTYKEWEVQIIRNAIEFKKKYDRWPNFMTAHPVTYDNCFAEVDRLIEESMKNPQAETKPEEPFDWDIFDITKPVENYPLQKMPISIEDGMFITPLFSMLWLDNKAYKEGSYRLSFGTNPGPDDGEEFEDSDDGEPLKLRLAA